MGAATSSSAARARTRSTAAAAATPRCSATGPTISSGLRATATTSLEGEAGQDALTFTGSDASERINLSDKGGRLSVTRNIGHVTLDANGIEKVKVVPLGGADRVFVHDLIKTDVRSVDANLGDTFTLESDGDPDEVTVDGTDHRDVVFIFGSDPLLQIPTAGIESGGPFVSIENPDGPLDRLTYRRAAATTTSTPTGSRTRSSASSSTAATETTTCSAAPVTTRSSAARGTTHWMAAGATTPSSSDRATAPRSRFRLSLRPVHVDLREIIRDR